MKLLSLDKFMKDTLNEDKLEKIYPLSFLEKKYRRYKSEQEFTKDIHYQIYISEHLIERFVERFVDGNVLINPDSTTLGATTKFKDLKGWKKLDRADFDRVLVDGINSCLTKFKLDFGAYFIVSKSTRLVIPMIVAKTDRADLRAVCLNTVLHTSMGNTDIFKLGRERYDSEKLVVEYNLYENIFEDKELGIYLDANVSNGVDFNHHVLFID
jgi:hypothetical protein